MKTLYVTNDVHKDAKAEAARLGIPLTDFVTALLREALNAFQKGGKK